MYVPLQNPKTYNYIKQRLISRFSEVTNEIKSDEVLVTRETRKKESLIWQNLRFIYKKNFSAGPAAQTVQKQKSCTTKRPLMQNWVFRLGVALYFQMFFRTKKMNKLSKLSWLKCRKSCLVFAFKTIWKKNVQPQLHFWRARALCTESS